MYKKVLHYESFLIESCTTANTKKIEIRWNVFNYKYQMAESNGLQNKDKNVLIKMFWDCK